MAKGKNNKSNKKIHFSVFKGRGKAVFGGVVVRRFFYSGNRPMCCATG